MTVDGKNDAFKRNYVITYDGEDDQLVPGAITVLPIDPVEPEDPSDNPDDEPDPTDGPTIWARNVVKAYDGVGTNVIAQVYNAVPGNTFTYEYSTNQIDFVAWDALQFTNVVAEQKVWYRAMTAQGNYLGVTNFAYVTITAAPIQAVPEGDDPDDPTKPWAQATSVECFIDEIPEGGSTNIIVTCGGFFGDDLNKTNVVYTTPGGWSEIGVYTNWCTVSCEPNYVPTNLMATVKIKEREGDVDGDTEPENADEIAEQMKDVAKAAGEYIKETTGEDPVYVEVRLVVNSTNSLPQAEQERTAQDAKKLEEKFGNDYPNYENVKGECVDIKLEFTTDPDRVDWTNIGSNNDEMVDIELTPDCALDAIVAIYRCHYSGSKVSYEKIEESASKPSGKNERWWRNKSKGVVHLHVKKFSLFAIFTGDKVTPPTPPPPPPPPPPPVVVEGAQVGDYRAQVAYVDMVKVQGSYNGAKISVAFKFVRNATIAGYVVYSDCACNDGSDGRTNPAYLVVKSSVQRIATPRIFPAELLVRMWDRSLGGSGTVQAEGYLFAGLGKGAWTFDQDATTRRLDPTDGNFRGYGVRPWANYDAFGEIGDCVTAERGARDLYKFGSDSTHATVRMFGTYNDKQGEAFYDAWMDHAGFGKASYHFTDGGCGEGDKGYCLQTLQGYLIGGLYICHPNAYNVDGEWDWFPCHYWEGTTDVVTGLWGMRRFSSECPATPLSAVDGSFYTGLHAIWDDESKMIAGYTLRGTAAAAGEGAVYYVNQQKAAHLFPYLKSCVIALGGANGLGFIDSEDRSFRTSFLLQDGSRDAWYDANQSESDENTPWEHWFRCACGIEPVE